MKAQQIPVSNPQKGQALMEFLVGFVAFKGVLVLSLGALLIMSTLVWIRVEAFALARAQLYGNDLSRCRASETLPQWMHSREFLCNQPGEVSYRLRFTKILGTEIKLQNRIELLP